MWIHSSLVFVFLFLGIITQLTIATDFPDGNSTPQDKKVFMAKQCEVTEQYEEMANLMKSYVDVKKSSLTIEERNLLSVASKNTVGKLRSSYRILTFSKANLVQAQED